MVIGKSGDRAGVHTVLAAHSSLAASTGVGREESSGAPGGLVSLQTSQLLTSKSLEPNLLEIIKIVVKMYLSHVFVKIRGWDIAIRFSSIYNFL